MYLPLLTFVLVAWVAKLTLFQPGMDWVAAAALPPVPGRVVVTAVTVGYVVAVVAAWPTDEGGLREIGDSDPDRRDE